MNGEAITNAIRGVLLGELGSVRTVSAGALVEGPPSDRDDFDRARSIVAMATPCFDVRVGPPGRTGWVGPSSASRAVLALEVLVTLSFPITAVADTESADHRQSVRALASERALAVTQALTWAGNLAADAEATATGLVSARLRELAPPRVKREDWAAGLYEVELRLAGLVLETQAVA